MQTIYIAMGNALRGDDGVALRVLELLEPAPGSLTRTVTQLTPELAAEIAPAKRVVFIDADPSSSRPQITPVDCSTLRSTPLAHALSPAELVRLAESLYGFAGQACICHVPAAVFDAGCRLSRRAEQGAIGAAELLRAPQYDMPGEVLDTA